MNSNMNNTYNDHIRVIAWFSLTMSILHNKHKYFNTFFNIGKDYMLKFMPRQILFSFE